MKVSKNKNRMPPIWELIIDKPDIKGLYGEISFLDFIKKENLED